jgi:amino acid adenylation domain-containing protein
MARRAAVPTVDLTRSLADLVAEIAAERPEAVAVEDGEHRRTYAELEAAAGGIARGLREAGVEDEEPVGVCLPRSWQTIVSFLGTLQAGAAYLPLDPSHPPQRLRSLLELAGARTVLTGAGHDRGLPSEVGLLDAESLARAGGAPPPPPAGGSRLACVLFTSGSTGRPKGVELMHRNLVHYVRRSGLVATEDDVGLQVVPLGFDLAAQEIWGALANGARLVLAPPGRPDPGRLGRLIAERGVTVLAVSAGLLHELVDAALPDLGGLRLVTSGGDVLSPAVAGELRRAHPSVRLWNTYGPTEATISATSHEVVEPDGEAVPIGRALPGYRVRVLDEQGAPVPEGAPGELWIGGAGVARAYRNDPERTAASFRPDPDGGLMYKSGDRVRLREDGELLFLGRLDDQVKISGQRVEPGEVRHALAGHPGVRAAAVVAREEVPGHKHLVGYAVPRPGAAPTPRELRDHVAERLPAYMVPNAIVLLDAMPLNERGKVDRSALPAPARRRPEDGSEADDPIAGLMAELLQLDSVGPDEDFFELGGTSLLAIQLVGRLRGRLGLPADIGAVFEASTPAALGGLLAGRKGLSDADSLPPLKPGRRARQAPLSAAQRRAWLFCRMNPESIAYQFAAFFRLEGTLDTGALQGALRDLLARHEILRTSFEEHDGEVRQVIHPDLAPRLETLDLRGAARDAWPRLVRERIRARIDPGDAPLIRWTLARLAEDSWALLHVEHHLIHDGWSFNVLAGELAELYSARVEERAPGLAPPAVQFQDYARWEREAHRGAAVRHQVEHWAASLDPDPPLLELPGARPRPPRESFVGGSVRRRLRPELAARLRGLANENGATFYMVALAAFLAQLHRYSGRDDLQIGSGLANRRDPESEQLIGMTVNTVALRCDLGGDPDVRELLARVRRTALDAFANADVPFDEVVRAVGARRDRARSPLIQCLFSFHDAPRAEERWAGLEARPVQTLPNGSAKADLNVIGVAERDGGMTFVWEHSDLLGDAAADRLAGHHLHLLEQFVERPDGLLSELDLMTGPERAELRAWNTQSATYDRAATVHGLIEAQARRATEATAVVDSTSRLSYGELLRRAGSVARSLREHGVERGDRVGVLLERSAALVTAQLGVVAAGAVYVPLDPLHPDARIARVLSDSGAEVALTRADLRERLPAGVAALDVEAEALGEPADPMAIAPDDLAYLLYTSGSTGDPKGVEVSHRNVVRLVDDPDYADLGPGNVILFAASTAFDAATFEVWGPLANGGAIACLPQRPTPDSVAEAIGRHGVTGLFLTTALFHGLVDRRPDCLAGIRQLLAGGEVISPDHVRRALAALQPEGRFTHCYGPTETTTFATTLDLTPGDPVEEPVPIGRPIQGTTCRVLDRDGREVPVGVAGELAIGGDGVARGYRGDPALTAARFRPDRSHPTGRLYLSGDRVRRRPDGVLEFLGRDDRQLKIRGVRVEPAEVESVLRSHPAIADVAVTPFEWAGGDRALAAYVVAKPGSVVPTPAEIRAHAADRLPEAMVPAASVTLGELPLTASGKLDRARLPEPGREHLASQGAGRRPRDEAERLVVRCFETVLEVSPIGVEDDFFALGGHSLLAVALLAELERIGGRRLPLSIVFEAPTPRELAARIGRDAPRSRWDNLVPLKPGGSRPPLFVVAAGDGNIVGFAPLARSLSAEQPLYALQPSGLDGRRPLDRGIGQMADRYISALRRVQPRGPYLLAGRCNGATVAFEMAQRLRAAGEEVPLLAALDSDPPPAKPFELAPGIAYDQIMEVAWVLARKAGEEVPDLEAPGGPAALVDWLRAPVTRELSRYLYEVWRYRWDLQRAFPEPLDGHGPLLAQWAWEHGRRELDIPFLFLFTEPVRPAGARQRAERLRAIASRRARELAIEARCRLAEELERRLDRPLQNARARTERSVIAAAAQARASYRADPWPGRVLLVTSEEFADKPPYVAWDVRAAEVDRRLLPVGHVEMLREPGAALLAACLEECIEEALER